MKTALIQTELAWEDIPKNLSRFEAIISRIAVDCDLIVMPEMFSVGFTMNPSVFSDDMLESIPAWMKQIANDYEVALAGSSPAAGENGYYNRFYFAAPKQSIDFYNKRHLFRMGEEQKHYRAGKERKIFQFNDWRILPQVCYDLRFPVWSRNRNDYDMMICVANWPEVRQDAWTTLLKARAIENQCYVAGVNRIGSDPNVFYNGGSVVFSPKGEIISYTSEKESSVLFASFSLDELNTFREKFPVWMDADRFFLKND